MDNAVILSQQRTGREPAPNGDWVDPFCTAVTSVFDQMIGTPVALQRASSADQLAVLLDITAVIGFSGETTGLVALTLPHATALGVAEALLGERHSQFDEQVADALGELLNMIAGAAKAHLPTNRPSLGLPTVVTGANSTIAFPSKACPTQLQFQSAMGHFALYIGLERH